MKPEEEARLQSLRYESGARPAVSSARVKRKPSLPENSQICPQRVRMKPGLPKSSQPCSLLPVRRKPGIPGKPGKPGRPTRGSLQYYESRRSQTSSLLNTSQEEVKTTLLHSLENNESGGSQTKTPFNVSQEEAKPAVFHSPDYN